MEAETYILALDEKSQAEIQQLIDAFHALEPLIEDFVAAVVDLWEQISAAVADTYAKIIAFCDAFYEPFQRIELYTSLRAYHLPHWLAEPIAAYWPRRWLPRQITHLTT